MNSSRYQAVNVSERILRKLLDTQKSHQRKNI